MVKLISHSQALLDPEITFSNNDNSNKHKQNKRNHSSLNQWTSKQHQPTRNVHLNSTPVTTYNHSFILQPTWEAYIKEVSYKKNLFTPPIRRSHPPK